MRRLTTVLILGAASLLAAPSASAATREYWVAAVPVTFNIVPNGRDAIMGMEYPTADTVFGTTVYRRTRSTGANRWPTSPPARAIRT